MNPQKFSAIAHRDHDYCNPISAAKIERLLDLLPLDESSRVLDLGCGRAELALRIIERFGSHGGRDRQLVADARRGARARASGRARSASCISTTSTSANSRPIPRRST